MKSFRNPKYLQGYRDVVFDLETALETTPANNAYQTRTGADIQEKLLHLTGIMQDYHLILK